jgi:chloramphenicol 3-O phosphotransferase
MKPTTVIFCIICTVIVVIGSLVTNKYFNTSYGTVIILNGPSGSGKSSIQKEFQNLMMPNLWVKIGIDNLFDSPMPNITLENMQYWQSPNPIRWVETSQDKNGHKVISLLVGEQGEKAIYAMNSAIATYAENGCNVIVDYIAYKKEWLGDLQQKLNMFKTYYVAVEIPLEVLEKREADRGTSPVGHARSHYKSVYGDISYDLVVNSEKSCALQIAEKLTSMIGKN